MDSGHTQLSGAIGTSELVDSINSSSGVARALYLGFLAFTAFIVVTLANTSDLDLLLLTPLTLPVLDVDVGLRGFYALIPFAYTLAHINLLVTLVLLSTKLSIFNQKLIFLSYESRAEHRATLHVFAPVQYLTGRHQGLLRFTLWVIVAVLLIWMPPATLLWIQIDFLAAQDSAVINAQRFALLIDVVFTYLLWQKLLRGKARSVGDVRLPGTAAPLLRGQKRSVAMLSLWLLLVSVVAVFGAVIPFGSWEQRIASWSSPWTRECVALTGDIVPKGKATDDKVVVATDTSAYRFRYARHCMNPITRWVFDGPEASGLVGRASENCGFKVFGIGPSVSMCWFAGKRALDNLDHLVLVQGSLDQQKIGEIRSKNILPSTLRMVGGLQLQNRSLNFANFRGSHFVNSDFTEIRAHGAEFRDSILTRVNFTGAKLQGAGFWTSDLRGVNFKLSQLQRSEFHGATLTGVNFQQANLNDANFQNTDQFGVRYQGIEAFGVKFNSSLFRAVEFRHVEIDGVKIGDRGVVGIGISNAKDMLSTSDVTAVLTRGTTINVKEYYEMICELPLLGIDSEIQHPYNLLNLRYPGAIDHLKVMVTLTEEGGCPVLSNSWSNLQRDRKQEIVIALGSSENIDIKIKDLNDAASQ